LLSNMGLCFIDYYFKCCMVGQKCKDNITGSTKRNFLFQLFEAG